MKDKVVEEIRTYRREHAKKFKYDLDAIFDDLKRQEVEGGLKTVIRQPKRVHKVAKIA